MSKRDKELFLLDSIVAIAKIKNVAARFRNPEDLKHDFVSWDSVVREFQIIGEATRQLIALDVFGPEKRAIVDFRNVLVHEYFGIDAEELWGVIYEHLDTLQARIAETFTAIATDKDTYLEQAIAENAHLDFVTDILKDLR